MEDLRLKKEEKEKENGKRKKENKKIENNGFEGSQVRKFTGSQIEYIYLIKSVCSSAFRRDNGRLKPELQAKEK